MHKYCGMVEHIGNWSGGMLVEEDSSKSRRVAKARIRGEIESVVIGNTTLRKPACTEGLFPHLEAGREACLYIYKHFLFKKYIIGVKYLDDGSRHLMPANEVRGTVLQYIFVWPLLMAVPGLLVGALLGQVVPGIGDYLPAVGLLGATGWCWWSAYSLKRDMAVARAD